MASNRLPPIGLEVRSRGPRTLPKVQESAAERRDPEGASEHANCKAITTLDQDTRWPGRDEAFAKRKSKRSSSDSHVPDDLKTGSASDRRRGRKTKDDVRSRHELLPVVKHALRGSKPKDGRRLSRGRAASLVSAASLVAFRKMHLANQNRADRKWLSRRQSMPAANLLRNQYESPTPPATPARLRDIRTPQLPSKPRFTATLSEAAQFATLQCYEDKLLDSLELNHPLKEGHPWHRLRTKTPNVARIRTRLGDETTEWRNDGVRSDPDCSLTSQSEHARNEGGLRSRGDYRKKLQVTYRLELAMDMVDKLKEERGELPLSPRRRQDKDLDPVRWCEDWIRGWKQEFPRVLGI